MFKMSSGTLNTVSVQKLNRTSARLYRVLLQQCRILLQIPSSGASGKSINNCTTIPPHVPQEGSCILLQRPIDPQTEYGAARIVPSYTSRSTRCVDEVDAYHVIMTFLQRFESLDKRHEERPGSSREDNDNLAISSLTKKAASSSTSSEQPTSIPTLSNYEVLTNGRMLYQTVRQAFRILHDGQQEQQVWNTTTSIRQAILQRQRKAIDAIRIFNLQLMLHQTSSINVDPIRKLRTLATSR